MRKIILFCVVLLFHDHVGAQSISDGLYVNERSLEFIYIRGDSIQFVLSNKDAFDTYSIGKGRFKLNKMNEYDIYSCDEIERLTSHIYTIPRKDSLSIIKILYDDNTPITSAYVCLKDMEHPNEATEAIYVSDTNGEIVLFKNQIRNKLNKEVILHVETLGFTTSKIILLNKGYEYVVRSAIPKEFPFTLFKTGKILIRKMNDNEIEVEIWRKKSIRKRRGSTVLQKDGTVKTLNSLLESFRIVCQ